MIETLTVGIHSEVSPLRAVMVHRPGAELLNMTQHQLEQLLFDDILSPPAAVREHDLMTELLRDAGARVIEMRDVLVAALDRAEEDSRRQLLEAICEQRGVREITDMLLEFEPSALASSLIGGLQWKDVAGPLTLSRLRCQHLDSSTSALPPCPNLMFMRDPCISVRDRVVVGRMATAARIIESWLVAFAIEHSGLCGTGTLLFDQYDLGRNQAYRSLEGGDVLVLSPEVLMIGCSERTSAQTIERLAREHLFPAFPDLSRVYVVLMPEQRTVMHLDTICTQIDRDLFLAYAPQICPGPEALPVAMLERNGGLALTPQATVLDVLRDTLGRYTAVIPCGGDNPIQQQREQWTDGANAFAVAPGKILLYARNALTIRALADQGFEETAIHWVQSPTERAERIAEGLARPRTVFSLPAGELSRARGGGRCLTMPLVRSEPSD
jgi:arginine deiminase